VLTCSHRDGRAADAHRRRDAEFLHTHGDAVHAPRVRLKSEQIRLLLLLLPSAMLSAATEDAAETLGTGRAGPLR
jgi:hypothetical protein